VILLTVGTQLPFDRLVRALDGWANAHPGIEIVGQIGPGAFRPKHFPAAAYIPPDKMDNLYDRADIVVAHAGMGSILTALVKRKPLIIFPRRAAMGEHRSDHQIATARHCAERNGIYVALDEQSLRVLLESFRELKAGDQLSADAPEEFINNLRVLIDAAG
jgi:UDP-N-acetylglucosamine transferase subunit ALG13